MRGDDLALLKQPSVCPVCGAAPLDRAPDGVELSYPHPMMVTLAQLAHVEVTGDEEHEAVCLHCRAVEWSDGLYVNADCAAGAWWQPPGAPPAALSLPGFAAEFKRLLALRVRR